MGLHDIHRSVTVSHQQGTSGEVGGGRCTSGEVGEGRGTSDEVERGRCTTGHTSPPLLSLYYTTEGVRFCGSAH